MGTRTNLRPYQVIPNAEASPANSSSMATSITSAPTVLQSISGASYMVVWTGGSTPVGLISLELSNDYAIGPDGQLKNAGNWVTGSLNVNGSVASSITVSGNTGSILIDPIETNAYACRLVYTRTSGSGTMTATINGKVK